MKDARLNSQQRWFFLREANETPLQSLFGGTVLEKVWLILSSIILAAIPAEIDCEEAAFSICNFSIDDTLTKLLVIITPLELACQVY